MRTVPGVFSKKWNMAPGFGAGGWGGVGMKRGDDLSSENSSLPVSAT